MSPKTVDDREHISHVLYVSTVGKSYVCLVCTRPYLSQTVSMISRYIHDPGRGHWEAVRWILQYIKSTVDVGLIFKKDVGGK